MIKIPSFKGHKHEERLTNKALKSLIIPSLKKNTEATFKEIESDGSPIIRVKFSSFGNKDSDNDILIKGCFSKSIKEHGANSASNRKIAFLWQHDMKNPIGKSLLEEELENGAYGNVKLSDFDSVPDSKRAYAQLKDGTLNQFSIGFYYIWDKIEYDEANDAFIVKEVNLFEYSVVTAGANEATEYMGLITPEEDLKQWMKGLKEYYPEKYNNLKTYISEIEKAAEPEKTLTASWISGFVSERLTQ